jgi:hypothetical protein
VSAALRQHYEPLPTTTVDVVPANNGAELLAFGSVEELPVGLYEVLVTEGLKTRMDALQGSLPADERALQAAEAPDRVAWHLSREIERAGRLGDDVAWSGALRGGCGPIVCDRDAGYAPLLVGAARYR